jgi:ferritin
MNRNLEDAINGQINNEFASSYSYLAMSNFCNAQAFQGCAKWLRIQSQEEHAHALKLLDFIIARGGTVKLNAIPQPAARYKSIPDVFEAAYSQEQEVSRQIDSLYEQALKEKQFAAAVELQWFLTEQVEEEKTSRDIVLKMRMVKNDPAALMDIDRELGSRSPDDK